MGYIGICGSQTDNGFLAVLVTLKLGINFDHFGLK